MGRAPQVRRVLGTSFAIAVLGALLAAAPAAAFQPLSQLGTGAPGDAAGQLTDPYQAAIDASGSVFVADPGNDRIAEFDRNGAFVRAFGADVGGAGVNVCTTSCQSGTNGGGAGQLDFPDGLAVDFSTGDVFVGDEGNNRIAVYAPDGTFLRAFGRDVIPGGGTGLETCTTSCQQGAGGTGAAGELDSPIGLAIDGAGNLFIAERGNLRVDVFTTGGAFQRAFGGDVGGAGVDVCTAACLSGTSGSAAGEFEDPVGVALDGAGNVFVVDDDIDRISRYTTGGTFVLAFGEDVGGPGVNVCTAVCAAGTTSGAAGGMDSPFGVATDPAGNVVVADSGNERVDVLTAAGNFQQAFGKDVDPGGGSGFEVCTAVCQAGSSGNELGAFNSPPDAFVDCRGTYFVTDGIGAVERIGEPGTKLAPCPSNDFSFGKLKRNKKKGTAKLTVHVPGPGILALAGKGLKPQRPGAGALASKTVSAAGKVKLLIKSKGKKRRKLKRTGKVKVKAKVTFTPTFGDPNQKTKKIKLKKRLRRHR